MDYHQHLEACNPSVFFLIFLSFLIFYDWAKTTNGREYARNSATKLQSAQSSLQVSAENSNCSLAAPCQPFQLVDSSCTFKHFRSNTILGEVNDSYNVVAILGCLTSGKSTIINEVFGTEFATMNSSDKSRPTTKGICMHIVHFESNCTKKPLVVLDIEGTDFLNGNGDCKPSTIFCVALADLVIVNLWERDIRNHLSNNALLRNILKAKSQLLLKEKKNQDESPRTNLAIFARDFEGDSTGDSTGELNKIIERDLKKIWTNIQKNVTGLPNFDSCFTSYLYEFPNKNYNEDHFKKKCDATSKFCANSLPATYTRKIEAPKFSEFCQNTWESI
eukprot:GHVP01025143.1.p1 GENE.GHVP01025143.1~~GHVP01025143.1.p1  ORF type:complete len:333 (-),score=51.35 GHVP01025143.1:536-1534(-)